MPTRIPSSRPHARPVARGPPLPRVPIRADTVVGWTEGERRADRFAAAVLASAPFRLDVGRVAPAAQPEGLGTGQPLPSSLVGELRDRVGIAFDRVRIHADRRADQLARTQGAYALAFGTHVVFSAGTYQPFGRRGRELLFHELGHVVQQSATHVDGRLELRETTGSGEPQARDVLGMTAPSVGDVVAFYKARHAGAPTAITAIDTWHADALAGLAPWSGTDTALVDLFAKQRAAAKASPSTQAAATAAATAADTAVVATIALPGLVPYFIDYLKARGDTAEAGRLLARFDATRTSFLHRGTLLAALGNHGASFGRLALSVWDSDPLFAGARRSTVQELMWTYVAGPSRSTPGIKVLGQWIQDAPEVGAGLAGLAPLPISHPPSSPLLRNESHWGPIQAIYDFDRYRVGLINDLHRWVDPAHAAGPFLTPTQRTWVEGELSSWFAGLGLSKPDYEPPKKPGMVKLRIGMGLQLFFRSSSLAAAAGLRDEAAFLLATVAPAWASALAPAIALWTDGSKLPSFDKLRWEKTEDKIQHFDPVLGEWVDVPDSTIRDLADLVRSGKAPGWSVLRTHLVKMAKRVLTRHKGAQPSISSTKAGGKIASPAWSYAGILQAELGALAGVGYAAFETRIFDGLRKQPDITADPKVYRELLSAVIGLLLIDDLRELLGGYDAARDTVEGAAASTAAKTPAPEPTMPGFTTPTPFSQTDRAGDLRLFHRFQVARWFVAVGGGLGWDDVQAAGSLVYDHRDTRLREPEIALRSDWVWDPADNLDDILTDFPGELSLTKQPDGTTSRRVGGIAFFDPLAMHHVYRYYKRKQYEEEKTYLDGFIASARGALDVPSTPLVNQAKATLRASFIRPRRAIVEDAEVELNDAVAHRYPKALLEHPKTEEFKAGSTGGLGDRVESPLWVIPALPPPTSPLVMWAVPDITPVIGMLRGDAALCKWVYEYHFSATPRPIPTFREGKEIQHGGLDKEHLDAALKKRADKMTKAEFDDPTVLVDEVWFMLLRLAFEGSKDKAGGLDEATYKLFADARQDQIDKKEVAHAALAASKRQATGIERNRRVRKWIADGIEVYRTGLDGLDRTRFLGKEYFKSDLDEAVYSALIDFSANLLTEADDAKAHRAAAMLELVDASDAALKRFARSDSQWLVQRYSHWTALCLEWTASNDKLVQVIDVLSDRSGTGDRIFTPDPTKSATVNDAGRIAARRQYVATQRSKVSTLDGSFASTIQGWLTSRGIKGKASQADGSAGTLHPVGSARHFTDDVSNPNESTFTWYPFQYAIVEVVRDFTYHPWSMSENPDLDESNPARHRGTSVVVVDGQTLNEKERSAPDHRPIDLIRITRNDHAQTITTRDELALHQFSHAVTMSLIHSGPAAFLDALKAIGNLILDGIEFIPGVGQVVMGARTAWGIVDFIAGPDFPKLMKALTDDPVEHIEAVVEEWKERLKFENMIHWLLFGIGRGKFALGRQADKRKKPADIARTSKNDKLRRFGWKIINLGVALFGAAASVRQRVQAKVLAAQLDVQENPTLRHLMLFIASNWQILRAVGKAIFAGVTGLSPKELGEKIQSSSQSILDTITGFPIPRTIIHVEDIVGIVLDFIVSKLKGKAGLAINVIKTGLEAIDQWHHVESAIAKPLEAIEPKMNGPWQSLIDGPLGTLFETGRATFAKLIVDGVNRIPGVSIGLTAPEGGVRDGDDTSLPDVDLAKTHTVDVFDGRPVPVPKLGQGKPLPADIKRVAEQKMFEHFNDVRLHVNAPADEFLQSLGAKGATLGGSHVMVSTDLLPLYTGPGLDTLLHELGHVTQQRGSHPANGPAAPPAQPPPIEVGIRRDPSLEANARALQKAAQKQGIKPDERVKIKTSVRGLQPDMGNVVPKLFHAMGSDDQMRAFRSVIDDEVTTSTRKPSASTKQATKNVWSRLTTLLGKTFAASAPFTTERALIATHITGNVGIKDDVEKAIVQIGARVQQRMDPSKPDMWLDGKLFISEFTRYLYGRTGVLISISPGLDTVEHTVGDKTKAFKVLSSAEPIESIAVRFLHPGLLSAGSKLYTSIIERSFPKTMKDKTGTPVPIDADHRRAIRTFLAGIVRSADGGAIYDRRASFIRIRSTVVSDVLERIQEAETAKDSGEHRLPADKLPPWDDYKKTTGGAVVSGHNSIGLRIGTFDTRKSAGSPDAQVGTERESHHITQFLLSEYLAHGSGASRSASKTKWVFKHLDRNDAADRDLYPFVTAVNGSGMPELIEGGGNTVKAATLAAGRGGVMPAILLARVTHRSGGLHISKIAGDYGDSVSTQGEVINAEFRSALATGESADFKKAEDAGKAALTAYMTKGDGKDPTKRSKIATAVNAAIQHTYNWMADHMQAALAPALHTHEAPYYTTIAKMKERTKPGVALTDDDLEFVHDETKRAKTMGFDVSASKMSTDLDAIAQEAIKTNNDDLIPFGLHRR